MTHLLLAQNVSKHYGGVAALSNARFELRPGEVHALMGENGAGKSTLARNIAGATLPDSGDIAIDGRVISFRGPLDAQQAGIGIIHQELDLFPNLTIGENVVIANLRFPERWRTHAGKIAAFCRPYLEQVGLSVSSRELAGSLSIGNQQLLVMARALSMNARILIMDEPTSALSEDAAERLFALIASLQVRGVAIVYVSHKMDEIFRISGRITVLRDGETIGTRETAATNVDEIISMMVGRPVTKSARAPQVKQETVLLAVAGLTTRKLRDVSFELRAGEVLGVAGLVGSGRSSLGAALFGLDRLQHGSLRVRGEPFTPREPAEAMRRGLGLLPEDRKLQGLMMQLSVRENGSLSVLPRLSRIGLIRHRRERELVDCLSRQLRLKCASHDAPVNTLSGGNQQKSLLARILAAEPEILFLDDPTRGIDIAAKEDIYRLIDSLAAQGKGVLLVSSELSELLRCSDRILVLNQGRVAGEFAAAEATQQRLIAAATCETFAPRRVS